MTADIGCMKKLRLLRELQQGERRCREYVQQKQFLYTTLVYGFRRVPSELGRGSAVL
jgi:hypothetical protein